MSGCDGQAFVLEDARRAIAQARFPDERTVIALPAADSLFPVLHHALTEFDDDRIMYRSAIRSPIHRCMVFFPRCSNSFPLMSMDDLKHRRTVKFVLHPYTKNIRWKERGRRHAHSFHVIEHYQTRRLLFFLRWESSADDNLIL